MKRAIALSLLGVSMACSIEPATTAPDTYADFLKLSRQASCEASLRCCGKVCAPTTDAAFYQPSARVFDYLNASLLEYNRQAAIDCLAATQQRYVSCDASVVELPPLTPCNNILMPKATTGSMCESGINSCAGTSFCTNSSCKPRLREGQVCNTSIQIPTCVSDSDSCCNFCSGVCSPGIAIGQTCMSGISCQLGAFCNGATMRCAASPGPGQACNDLSAACDPRSGLVCPPGILTCVPPQNNGAVCNTNAHCASGYCRLPNLPSPTGGTCQPPPAPVTVREQLCTVP